MVKKVLTDVDIDVINRDEVLKRIECIYGRIDRPNNTFEKHPTGVFFQNIPRDPTTNISTVDHRVANNYGYFKIDFLNVNMYEFVRDEEHLKELVNKEPPWDFFEYQEITDKLFHLKGHSELLNLHKPKSVEDLAMILAIIRPAKAYLKGKSWDKIKKEVWTVVSGDDTYQFHRAHAISYAISVVVHMHLLVEQMAKE